MRIAYIAPYQGPGLLRIRPCLHNLSLAAKVKIQLIAELLQERLHEVEIISQGEVDKYQLRYYPQFSENELFRPNIPIYYVSALPVRFVSGFWESIGAQRLLEVRHRLRPYDAVIIYNMNRAQIGCARFAMRRLGLPVILEYEDDSFVNVVGRSGSGLIAKYHRYACRKILKAASGGIGVSPYLLSQMPLDVPKFLLRGVVSGEIVRLGQSGSVSRRNWVVFSGTHEGTQGLEELIKAWSMLDLTDWELHIAGHGPLTPVLEKMAEGNRSITFHGLLNREENARLLHTAKIGMNPRPVTRTPGNVFSFKIVEYLAAGCHVIMTPRGQLEPELEAGISYIADNSADTIAVCLKKVIESRRYERTAERAALQIYGPAAVSKSLNDLLAKVAAGRRKKLERPQPGVVVSAGVR